MKFKDKLRKELSDLLGLQKVILFSSCRNALYTLLRSLNLKENDEVIVQSFICSTLPMAIKAAGGKVVLAEVDEKTFNLSLDDLRKKITNNTKVVIFVHTYGNPSGIQEVQQLCKEHNLILIEDIAQALGASYCGKLAGTFGDFTVYSFTKQLINIGGGALLSNHNLSKVRRLRDKLDMEKELKLIEYPKRLITSLYETRAFFLSKILIDLARKKAMKFKVALNLDPHFNCNNIEAYLASTQIKSLKKKIRKRMNNYNYIKAKVRTQQIDSLSISSHTYLSFIFPNQETRNQVIKKNFLFLPPWKGTELSKKLIFVPNNPNFSKRKLNSFINIYKKALK